MRQYVGKQLKSSTSVTVVGVPFFDFIIKAQNDLKYPKVFALYTRAPDLTTYTVELAKKTTSWKSSTLRLFDEATCERNDRALSSLAQRPSPGGGGQWDGSKIFKECKEWYLSLKNGDANEYAALQVELGDFVLALHEHVVGAVMAARGRPMRASPDKNSSRKSRTQASATPSGKEAHRAAMEEKDESLSRTVKHQELIWWTIHCLADKCGALSPTILNTSPFDDIFTTHASAIMVPPLEGVPSFLTDLGTLWKHLEAPPPPMGMLSNLGSLLDALVAPPPPLPPRTAKANAKAKLAAGHGPFGGGTDDEEDDEEDEDDDEDAADEEASAAPAAAEEEEDTGELDNDEVPEKVPLPECTAVQQAFVDICAAQYARQGKGGHETLSLILRATSRTIHADKDSLLDWLALKLLDKCTVHSDPYSLGSPPEKPNADEYGWATSKLAELSVLVPQLNAQLETQRDAVNLAYTAMAVDYTEKANAHARATLLYHEVEMELRKAKAQQAWSEQLHMNHKAAEEAATKAAAKAAEAVEAAPKAIAASQSSAGGSAALRMNTTGVAVNLDQPMDAFLDSLLLPKVNLEKYKVMFEEHEIMTVGCLKLFTEQNVKEFGVKAGTLMRIKEAIGSFAAEP